MTPRRASLSRVAAAKVAAGRRTKMKLLRADRPLRFSRARVITAEGSAVCKEGVFYEVSVRILFNIAGCMNPYRFDILGSLRRRSTPV